MIEGRHEVGPGLIANRFKPIRVLRQNVLHARDGRRHVAIELVPAVEHDLAAMQRAIAIANRIDHPNLCRPREVLEHADQLVIVTELVEGVSIADRLTIGPFDPLQVGALLVELLSVLARIHAEGLAHGGISPTTVMIDANGALRLMDLGVVRTPQVPTPRRDLESIGQLASTMLAGYQGSVPAHLTAWCVRCVDPVRPFPDVAAAAAGLMTPAVVSTEAPRTRTLTGLGGKKAASSPRTERSESSVAIKIPTLEEPAKPLEVVITDPTEIRRGRTPSAMIRTADALALAESYARGDTPVAPEPTRAAPAPAEPVREPSEPSVEAPLETPAEAIEAPVEAPLEARPRRSRFAWVAGGLAAAAAVVAIFIATREAPAEPPPPPSVVWVSQPIEQPPVPPALRPKPPLPTGAVLVPDAPAPRVPIAPIAPPPKPPARPTVPVIASAVSAAEPVALLEVAFSPDSAWIETPGVYVLEDAYRQLVRVPGARLEIIGYSSSDGREARNAQLAVGRALAVRKYMIGRGVEAKRIALVAKPSVGDDATQSRRAEVRILPP